MATSATMTKAGWRRFAKGCAASAHEDHFASRRGVWYYEDLDVLVLYDNNPYADRPQRRGEELAEFRGRLRAAGVEELAYATYPEDGYTYALVMDAGRDREQFVRDAMTDVLSKSLGLGRAEPKPD